MDSLEQRIKIQTVFCGNDNLAIEDKLAIQQPLQSLHQFRKVAGQRLPSLGLQDDLVVVTEGKAAEAVPLRLIEPSCLARNLCNRLGFGRRIGRLKRQAQL